MYEPERYENNCAFFTARDGEDVRTCILTVSGTFVVRIYEIIYVSARLVDLNI